MIELLVSLGLITLIASISMPALVFAMKVNNQNRIKSTANTLAKDVIEKVNGTPYDKIGNINGSPEGIFERNTNKTIDGIDYNIDTLITWEKRGSDSKALKNIKVTVKAPDAFTKAEKVVCEMCTSVSSGKRRDENERVGNLILMVKNVNDDNSYINNGTIEVFVEGPQEVEESERTLMRAYINQYNSETSYKEITSGTYKITVQIPPGYGSPLAQSNPNVITKTITVASGSDEKVCFYIDKSDNLIKFNFNFYLPNSEPYYFNGGALTINWEFDGIQEILLSNIEIYGYEYVVNNLWPLGKYKVKLTNQNLSEPVVLDGEVVDPMTDIGGPVYVSWPAW